MTRLLAYKEILLFCIIYSLSFILIGEIARSVDPVTSIFVIYGLTLITFTLINISSISKIAKESLNNLRLFIQINSSTFILVLTAYLAMTFVSPLFYVVIYFGSIAYFVSTLKYKKIDFSSNLIVLVSSLIVSFIISTSDLSHILFGLILSLISALFTAVYLTKSEEFQFITKLTPSQLLNVRFILIFIICGFITINNFTLVHLSANEWFTLTLISIFGSIIPLFFLQSSVIKIGAYKTGIFMPTIPIICLFFTSIITDNSTNVKEIIAVFIFSILFLWSTIKANAS